MRETLPDGILSLADEVILIDVTPETLRQRLREGKIYPPNRIETALANFFRTENLFALRELALREALRARHRERIASPFERILLAVGSRPVDLAMIAARRTHRRASRHRVCDRARGRPARARRCKRSSKNCAAEARKTNAEWIDAVADDAPKRLLEIARARPETTIALAGTRRSRRWLERPSFSRRLLDAGARELLVLMRPTRPEAPASLGTP